METLREYLVPEIEIIVLDEVDVIRTSGNETGGGFDYSDDDF